MACCVTLSWAGTLFLIFVIYKLLDRLIRIPYVGRYSDRYILVTGCDSGFGQSIARRLDKLGCHVFAGCLTEIGQVELESSSSKRLKAFQLDVSDHSSVLSGYDFVKSNLPSGKGLWGIMNNAGIMGPCGPNEWIGIEDYKKVLSVNTYGLIDVTMTFLPLVKKGRGRIVNTASVFGRLSLNGCTPYCISKYGVEAFTDALRRSLRIYDCKALLIEPGIHRTHITSSQNINKQFDDAWKSASDEVKAEFGEEWYQYHSKKVGGRFDNLSSGRISDVVDAYEHALLGRFPRARYVVGRDALFLWLPIQWMPEWLGDWLLETMARRSEPDLPLPAAIKKNL